MTPCPDPQLLFCLFVLFVCLFVFGQNFSLNQSSLIHLASDSPGFSHLWPFRLGSQMYTDVPDFCVGAGNLNSGLRACTASSLPTEPHRVGRRSPSTVLLSLFSSLASPHLSSQPTLKCSRLKYTQALMWFKPITASHLK